MEGNFTSPYFSTYRTPFLCLNSEVNMAENPVLEPRPQLFTAFMECTVCFDLPIPIYQCSNGHIICHSCWGRLSRVKTCPTCRVVLAEPARNLALEKILESYKVQMPCKFRSRGCATRLTYGQKAEHQKVCAFRAYPCPVYHACNWEGYLEELAEHLSGPNRSQHALPVVYGDNASIHFTLEWGSNPEVDDYFPDLRLLNCFGEFFVIAIHAKRINTTCEHEEETSNVEYSAVVQYIGKPESARTFAYRMELECAGRRCSWEAIPLNLTDNIKSAMEKGDCFSFDSKKVALFATGEIGSITIEVTITETGPAATCL